MPPAAAGGAPPAAAGAAAPLRPAPAGGAGMYAEPGADGGAVAAWSDDGHLAVACGRAAVVLAGGRPAAPRGVAAPPPPTLGPADVGCRVRSVDPCLRHHLHLATAPLDASKGGSPPTVVGVAWSPAGAAPDGGCLLALLTSAGDLHVMAAPAGGGREWEAVADPGAAVRASLRDGGWPDAPGGGADDGESESDQEDEAAAEGGGRSPSPEDAPGPARRPSLASTAGPSMPPPRAHRAGGAAPARDARLPAAERTFARARAAAHAARAASLPTYETQNQHLKGADLTMLKHAAAAAAGAGAGAAERARVESALRARLRKIWDRVGDPACARIALDPEVGDGESSREGTPAPVATAAVSAPRADGSPPPSPGAILRTAWRAAYPHFLALRSAEPVAGQKYARGQHLRGIDAELATKAAADVCAADAAALAAARVSPADVARETRAVIRRRLVKPGQDEARDGVFVLSAAAAAEAGRRAARPPRGAGSRSPSPDPGDKRERPPSFDVAYGLATKRAAGKGEVKGAATAAARVAAASLVAVAWSPPLPSSPSSSLLVAASADGGVWAWVVRHPAAHAAGAGGREGARATFELAGRARAFRRQPATALAFAAGAADAPCVLIAGGGLGGVAALAWGGGGGASASAPPRGARGRTAPAAPPLPAPFLPPTRLLAADGRPVTALDARFEGDGGAGWHLRVAAGKGGGALAAWPALKGAGAAPAAAVAALAAAPPPAWTYVSSGATCVGVAWAATGASLAAGWGDGRVSAARAARGALAPASPDLPAPPAPDGSPLGLHSLARSTTGLLVAALRRAPPPATANDAGSAKIRAAALTRARLESWCTLPSVDAPTSADAERALAAVASSLRAAAGAATGAVADAAAALRAEPPAVVTAFLESLEAPLHAAFERGGVLALAPDAARGAARATALRRALAAVPPTPASPDDAGELGDGDVAKAAGWDGAPGDGDARVRSTDAALLLIKAAADFAAAIACPPTSPDARAGILAAASWAAGAAAALAGGPRGLAAAATEAAAAGAAAAAALKARAPAACPDAAADPVAASRRVTVGGRVVQRCAAAWGPLPAGAVPWACRLCGRRAAAPPATGPLAGCLGGAPACAACGVALARPAGAGAPPRPPLP